MKLLSARTTAVAAFALVAACSSAPSAETANDATEPAAKGGFTAGKTDPTRSDATGECVKDPSFYDVPGDGCDNDGDGKVDNATPCDDATGDSATDFAHAMGICADAEKNGFGLVAAEFTRGWDDAKAPPKEQHGVLPKFGDLLKPREGAMLGVLSTGFAQEFNGKDGKAFSSGERWWGWLGGSTTALPSGFPKAAGDCPQSKDVTDVIVLKLTLKAPKNATGLKFDFDFHSSEWPSFVCSQFNDGFLAFLASKATNDNISFDAKNNPVSVNNGFFDRCTADATTGCSGKTEKKAACEAGPGELAGTGFGVSGFGCDGTTTRGGATGWLSSAAPIEAGETFTLSLAIWDTGDGNLDSTVLVDNFQWVGGQITKPTTERPSDEVK